MWSSVLVLALPIALDPVRLGVNLLLVSRPRPAQNLLVYWIGCVSASFVLLLVPLLVLHFTPVFSSFVHDLANPGTTASSTVRHVQVFLGALILAIAAYGGAPWRGAGHGGAPRTPRDRVRLRKPMRLANLAAVEAWPGRARGRWVASPANAGPGPAGRGRAAPCGWRWRSASGRGRTPPSSCSPSPRSCLLEPSFGAQLGAAVVFILSSLALVEIVLVANLLAPTGTQAALRRLHDWVAGYRQLIVVAILTLVGLAFVAQGAGVL